MFKEILSIIPKLDSAAMEKLSRSLNSRFVKIAKGFSKGLIGAIKGGGVLGLATSAIDKLLNPLKETQEAIDRTLSTAGDVVTNAEQFGATPGELFKLQKLAQAKGLDASSLDQLLLKFQASIAEAVADPTKQTSVRAYTNDTNTVASFFQFIQALSKLERNQQILVQQEVFGEKQTLKMAEFLRANFTELGKQVGVKDAAEYTPGLQKLDDIGDLAEALKARRELDDMEKKSGVITEGMIRARNVAEKTELGRENDRIANYKNLQSISDTSSKIMGLVETGLFKMGEFIAIATPAVNNLVKQVDAIAKSGFVRGVRGFFGGDK